MAEIRITFSKNEEYLVDFLRDKTKPNLFIKDLIKEAMYHEYYRLTGNIPSFFEEIANNSIVLTNNDVNRVVDVPPVHNDDEDDVGVDISDMEDF